MPATAGIQYSATLIIDTMGWRLLDRPVKPDDDASLE
jgi:hypothetical protein